MVLSLLESQPSTIWSATNNTDLESLAYTTLYKAKGIVLCHVNCNVYGLCDVPSSCTNLLLLQYANLQRQLIVMMAFVQISSMWMHVTASCWQITIHSKRYILVTWTDKVRLAIVYAHAFVKTDAEIGLLLFMYWYTFTFILFWHVIPPSSSMVFGISIAISI